MGKSSKKTKTKSSEPADAEVEQPQSKIKNNRSIELFIKLVSLNIISPLDLPTLISPTLKRKTKRSSITAGLCRRLFLLRILLDDVCLRFSRFEHD